MIRNIVLLDGTWNTPRDFTNICKESWEERVAERLIPPCGADGVQQNVRYFSGVGAQGFKIVGGTVGFGLRTIVQNAYDWVVDNYRDDQELYIYGFSRGAYAARALAGLIGDCGIRKTKDRSIFKIARANRRAREASRRGGPPSGPDIQANNRIALLGVFDTVGSYGVPAGFSGLAPLGRYLTLLFFGGFEDTQLGAHVDHALHAIGVDERRRPFIPTFWTVKKGEAHPRNIEQNWFPGVHSNVGGGYPESGLSDIALIWMIARTQALTGLSFDNDAIRRMLLPNIDGDIPDSAEKYPIDRSFPRSREMFAAGAPANSLLWGGSPDEEHVNEKVHWSVLAKLGRSCEIYGVDNTRYDPPNLKAAMARLGPDIAARIAYITPEEARLLSPNLVALAEAHAVLHSAAALS
ncbi:phospholipase effector Tle1 domain-containing protein [Methylocystis sp.]|uniref:phospholipase effector Tle1 domain-containing protein n=1 Tax=Methylocystis sp. TaxID=1911079 RepID=UPI003D0FE443